jgi:membrane associated rhomboid family serine protease
MIPIKDNIPSRKRPFVTIAFIAINVVVFIYEMSLGRNINTFIFQFGMIPKNIVAGQNLHTLFTSMFLHGGFWHILGNMLYLYIFGDNVEDAFGHFGFLIMYLVSGLVGSAAHILTAVGSKIPTIGASGAVSGVLGAYFVLYPRAQVLALVPIFFFIRIMALPAFIFLGFWFLLQLLYGAGSMGGGAGVAFFAHIGGFVIGILLGLLVKNRVRRQGVRYEIH